MALLILASILTLFAASCRTASILQPGAPGSPSRVITGGAATDLTKVGYTDADVKFMQGMIHHHLQAIDMTNLLAQNTASDDMRKLGLRMQLSQADEIKMMQKWLQTRGKEAPGDHAHHTPGAPMMPGMLSAEEMSRLAAAKGVAFDKLFLEGMIKHHMGALVMVEELFATPGAAQESDMFAFASDVVTDQRIEIDRMAVMLKELQK
jgi:uncharacterized protein (DUF305 family)